MYYKNKNTTLSSFFWGSDEINDRYTAKVMPTAYIWTEDMAYFIPWTLENWSSFSNNHTWARSKVNRMHS